MGGMVRDLLPNKLQEGTPSVYFRSKDTVICGENALRPRAMPVSNRQSYLNIHFNGAVPMQPT